MGQEIIILKHEREIIKEQILLLIIKESQLQREKRKKSFVRKERRKMKSVVNVRLAGHLLQRRVRLKTVHIFLPVQMDLYIWQFRLL